MPSITEDYTMTLQSLSKKRKHADASPTLHPNRISHNYDAFSANRDILARKIHTLPPKKRAKTADIESPSEQTPSSRPQPNRVATVPAAATPSLSGPKKDLSACHICHRKPQKRSDLDSYSNCEGCGRRTCYICIRECNSWMPPPENENGLLPMAEEQDGDSDAQDLSFEMQDAGSYRDDERDKLTASLPSLTSPDWWKRQHRHRTVICSQCCVETGLDGKTMCLACLAFVDKERNAHLH